MQPDMNQTELDDAASVSAAAVQPAKKPAQKPAMEVRDLFFSYGK